MASPQAHPTGQELRGDVRNLRHSLRREVAWKEASLREGHWYLRALAANGPECRRICSDYMVKLADRMRADLGRPPRILDVGCGPISSLAHLQHEGLAEVVGVDPLAEDYRVLLARYGLESPVTQLAGSGESLDRIPLGPAFDAAFCRNALDHHLSPVLTWLNMFRVVGVGGLLIQSHSVREATKQEWRQLHQFDLWADPEGHLFIEDGHGARYSLTRGLPVEVVANHQSRAGEGWMTVAYRKTASDESAKFLSGVVEQLQATFLARSEWALELEDLLFERTAEPHRTRRALDFRGRASRTLPAGAGRLARRLRRRVGRRVRR